MSLIKKIHDHLFKAANPPFDGSGAPRIRPSDLGNDSLRRIFYSYLRVPPDEKISAPLKKIFDVGTSLHNMIKEWLDAAGLLIPYVDPATGKPPISKFTGKPDHEFPVILEELDIKLGKVDAVLLLDNQLWICEIKSINNFKFGQLQEAAPEHQMQANIYVHLFEHCLHRGDYAHVRELKGHEGVAGSVILYINKDSGALKEFFVEKNDRDLDQIVKKIAKIKTHVANHTLPKCSCEYKKSCPWNRKCKANFNPLV